MRRQIFYYYIVFLCFHTAEYQHAVAYLEARREQEPLVFNENRASEQPLPNDEIHDNDEEEVLIDAFATGAELDKVAEEDPLQDIKPDLQLFVISDEDRSELALMLMEENTNAEIAVHAETSVAEFNFGASTSANSRNGTVETADAPDASEENSNHVDPDSGASTSGENSRIVIVGTADSPAPNGAGENSNDDDPDSGASTSDENSRIVIVETANYNRRK